MKHFKTIILAGILIIFYSNINAQNNEIRGVWLTNVDSRVLESRESISEAMQFLADHHFNLVCPVVWNKGWTLYRSQLMDSLFDVPIDPVYDERDPLAELILTKCRRRAGDWHSVGVRSANSKPISGPTRLCPVGAAVCTATLGGGKSLPCVIVTCTGSTPR